MFNPFETIEARLNNIETLLLDLKHKSTEPSNQNTDNLPIIVVYSVTHVRPSQSDPKKKTVKRKTKKSKRSPKNKENRWAVFLYAIIKLIFCLINSFECVRNVW